MRTPYKDNIWIFSDGFSGGGGAVRKVKGEEDETAKRAGGRECSTKESDWGQHGRIRHREN